MIDAVGQLASTIGVAGACNAIMVPRATYYRHQARQRTPSIEADKEVKPPQGPADRQEVGR